MIACPGGGDPPAEWPNVRGRDLPEGYGVCPRCGAGHKLRNDGRLRAHKVNDSAVIPAIRGARFTSGRIESRRA